MHNIAPIRRVPWPQGIFDLYRVEDIEPGVMLAPVPWEVDYLRTGRVLPWATVDRRALVHRVLDAHGSRREAKVACRTPCGEHLYYTAGPRELVRVLLLTTPQDR